MKASKISDESKALHKLYREGEIDHETLEDTMTGLALLPPQETALAVYSKQNGLEPYLQAVFDKVAEFEANKPTLETEKGRKEYRSMAHKVAKFKTAIDGLGKEVNDQLKLVPKLVDAERRRVWDKLEALQKKVLQPVIDWDAEQKAIEEKRLADIAAKELQAQVDRDHELAVFIYAEHLRQVEEAKKQAIIDAELAAKAQKEREEQIAREAVEAAMIAAEQAAEQKAKDAQLAIEKAQREKAEAEAAALRQQQESERAAAKAKQDAEDARIAAEKKAEADKLAAIEAERQRIENERLDAERKQQELEKNRSHVGQKRKEAKESIMEICGLSENAAKAIVLAIAGGKIKKYLFSFLTAFITSVNRPSIVIFSSRSLPIVLHLEIPLSSVWM